MAKAGVFAGLPLEDFKAGVSKLLSSMGYSLESSESSGDGFMFFAVKSDPLGAVKTLIYVFLLPSAVSEKKVREVLKLAEAKSILKVVLASNSGFSDSALKFSSKHGISTIDKKALEDLMQKYGIRSFEREKIFEFAFELGRTMAEAGEDFEKERGRKLFGFGVEEKVASVVGRYAPVGSFLITREELVKTGFSKTPKTVTKSNMFYVNLSSNELYYISRGLGKRVKLQALDILNRLMPLPLEAVRMLADVLKSGEMPMEELNERYELFYEENKNDFLVLLKEGLVAMNPSRRGFLPAIAIPAFDNPRYDLKKFTSIKKSVSSEYGVDELKYDPKDVVKLLELVFSGRGEVKEVVYLPYYICGYADDRSMSRWKVLLAPKYLD